MNDPILRAQVKEFAEREGLNDASGHPALDDAEIFERFANYTVLARLYGTDVPLPDFSMGNAPGIDGIAALVNNQFVENEETLRGIAATSIEAEFVFTQIKRSERIDEGDIRKFCAAVSDFIKHPAASAPTENEDIARMRAVRDSLFDRSQHFSEPPTAKLYYVYAGKYHTSASIESIFESLRRDLVDESCFLSQLTWVLLDIDKIRDWYRTVTRGVSKDIQFKDRVELPPVAGVTLAVLGYMRAKDYLALLTDETGSLEQGIFYENVRAFLGNTKTNVEIATTLRSESGTSQEWFPLLHNGITVVARSVVQLGSKLSLRGVQIVNGCQSSNILHELRTRVNPELPIPTKVIVTESSDITDSIIRGTNRQNEIKDEAFVAMDSFQKGLESFYTAFVKQVDVRPGLVYERRAHQYEQWSGSPHLYAVSIPIQIKSFIGMFSGEPHFAHRYYGQLLEQFAYGPNASLFALSHRDKFAPYYVSSLFSIQLDRLWSRMILDRQFRSFKFLLLDVLRLAIFEKSLAQIMNQPPKSVNAESLRALGFWREGSAAVQRIRDTLVEIDTLYRRFSFNSRQNAAQSVDFTRAVQQRFGGNATERSLFETREVPIGQHRGTITNAGHSFGFIDSTVHPRLFFHVSALNGMERIPPPGTKVLFDITSTVRGIQATNISIVSPKN